MTRSLLSTSFVLVALGSTLLACGDSSGSSGDGGTGPGTGGSSTTTNSMTGGGGAGGTTSTTTSSSGGGGSGGMTSSSSGGGGSGGMTSSSSGGGGSGGMTSSSSGSGGTTTTVTPPEDEDQDGWKVSDGDCCDSPNAGCSDTPELINPGALEYPGNTVDDDCNPATLDGDAYPTCSTATQANADITAQAVVSSTKLVKAMDLCQFTSESPALNQKTWGVITAKLTLADGTEVVAPKNIQVGVLPDFGPNVKTQFGETMAAISSGTARRLNHPGIADPGYVHPQNGLAAGQDGTFNAGTQCPAPPEYVMANGGVLPSPCGNCMGPNCTVAYDSVALRIRIRPPTNAKSFSYRFNFFSAEYPEYLCEDFNDFFVALISGNLSPEIPADKNIAFDANHNPVSANNAFFDVCFPAVGAPPGSCSGGTLQLVGNGMGGWGGSISDGGATGWLQNDVPLALKDNPNFQPPPNDPNAKPDQIPTAEVFELQLIVWDAGDHNVDSIALLDRFRWNLNPAALGVHH
jgi:hypothetical protein